jgi:hypothetical protein
MCHLLQLIRAGLLRAVELLPRDFQKFGH